MAIMFVAHLLVVAYLAALAPPVHQHGSSSEKQFQRSLRSPAVSGEARHYLPLKQSMSEFRLARLTYVFEKFFDTDRSGTIEKEDFVRDVDVGIRNLPSLLKVQGWPEGEADRKKASVTLLKMWDVLRKQCRKEDNEKISQQEFVQLWKNPEKNDEWESEFMGLVFELQDTSGDGVIDEDEFVTFATHFGVRPTVARLAFKMFSVRGYVAVDRKYYEKLWKEYFGSNDPATFGNYIFGKISFADILHI